MAQLRENGCLCPQWAVCFLSTEQMPGRPVSLLCQSQAIRANGSTCLYVGRVWGLLFSRIGHFLFPGSWKTLGSEKIFILSLEAWAAQGSSFPSLIWPEAKTLFWGRVWIASFPWSILECGRPMFGSGMAAAHFNVYEVPRMVLKSQFSSLPSRSSSVKRLGVLSPLRDLEKACYLTGNDC